MIGGYAELVIWRLRFIFGCRSGWSGLRRSRSGGGAGRQNMDLLDRQGDDRRHETPNTTCEATNQGQSTRSASAGLAMPIRL